MSAATTDFTPDTLNVKYIVRCGIKFEVTTVTPRHIILRSTKTNKTATFTSITALNNFIAQWEWWHGYKRATALEVA